MNALIYHVAGGSAFFAGISLLLLAAVLASVHNRLLQSFATLTGLLGLIAVIISATPLPWWFFFLATGIAFVWLVAINFKNVPQRGRRLASMALAAAALAALVLELPYHVIPVLPSAAPTITLFADSVSAGLSDNDIGVWPKLLEQGRPVKIRNHSQMGATAASALKRAQKVDIPAGVVLVEIGGNDLLGNTTAAQFERDLDALLAQVSGPERLVVMFELPLPPFANSFGLAQRRVAQKHQVYLIPKRIFLAVLTADEATLDSIHLSRAGHQLMAEVVWEILGPSFATQGS